MPHAEIYSVERIGTIARFFGVIGSRLNRGKEGQTDFFPSNLENATVMPGRYRRHFTNRQRLLFDFLRSHVPGLYPADDTLLGLDHEPIIAAGTLNHRRKNFSLIQLTQLF
jgi:hypothetical protein